MKSVPVLFGLVALLGLASCRHVNPWERSKLAHPTMTGEMTSPAADHMYSVQEGAVGGGGPVESGCGCN
jgi:hypothetical protein